MASEPGGARGHEAESVDSTGTGTAPTAGEGVQEGEAADAGSAGSETAALPPGSGANGGADREQLLQQLSTSLESFDGVLLEEARALESKPGRSADAGEEGQGRAGSVAGGASGSGAESGAEGTAGGGGDPSSEQAASGRDGPGGSGGAAQAPQDVGDGSDDDIIARNLREAAMEESDPELREKLWEEYRDYKRGTD